MRRPAGLAAILSACMAAMAFAQPAPPPPTPPPAWPNEDAGYVYACTTVFRDRHGTLTMNVEVSDVGPGGTGYFGQWTSVQGSGGLTLSYHLFDGDMRVTDDTSISLTFEARWRGNPRAFILLSRSGRYGGLELAFRNNVARAVRGRLGTIATLGDIRAYAGGAPLTVLAMDRRMRVLARDRIDPALLDAAVAAAGALRAEAHRMAADYRNRCERREAREHIMI